MAVLKTTRCLSRQVGDWFTAGPTGLLQRLVIHGLPAPPPRAEATARELPVPPAPQHGDGAYTERRRELERRWAAEAAGRTAEAARRQGSLASLRTRRQAERGGEAAGHGGAPSRSFSSDDAATPRAGPVGAAAVAAAQVAVIIRGPAAAGKSTVAAGVAAALRRAGRSVCALDQVCAHYNPYCS